MTTNEIVRALLICSRRTDCKGCGPCPLFENKDCMSDVTAAAADLIERLTAENAALREKVPQWISVEDKLPTPGARVLITDGRFVGEGFLSGKIFSGCGERSRWKRYDNNLWKNTMKTEITHWMALPETPEEGE